MTTNEVLELRRCCAQRGARLEILKEWMSIREWAEFITENPEAEDWFDEDGVPN